MTTETGLRDHGERADAASDLTIDQVRASSYRVPLEVAQSDGTLAWDHTSVVVAEARAGSTSGLGYSYGSEAAARVIDDTLAGEVTGLDPMDVPRAWTAMVRAVRNLGRPGIASHAIAAVDIALSDLKSRLLGLPLVHLLGRVRDHVDVYGSGGFTSASVPELCDQLEGWAEQGIPRVKMKVGRHPLEDVARVHSARDALGPDVELFVDANGAYDRKEALRLVESFAQLDVRWFEEPVSSDDLVGLRLLRDRAASVVEVAAGEYGYDLGCFRRMLSAGAVDVLQADATRCAGFTGFLQVGALCQVSSVPLSAHTAPSLHVHVACALPAVRHVEWFADHVAVERLLFDGAPQPEHGRLAPDTTATGLGLELKLTDANPYQTWSAS